MGPFYASAPVRGPGLIPGLLKLGLMMIYWVGYGVYLLYKYLFLALVWLVRQAVPYVRTAVDAWRSRKVHYQGVGVHPSLTADTVPIPREPVDVRHVVWSPETADQFK